MSAPRTVALIDDHNLFRQGVRALLESSAAVQVVGEGATSEEALALVDRRSPDVLLLDVEIPGQPAELTIRRIRRTHPQTAIVVLTMHTDAVLERQLMRAGAAQFVAKTVTSDALAEIVVAARAPAASIPQRADSEADSSPLLTSREREVLRMIAQAYTNRDIAAHLRIAEGTVKRHATNMYVKLGATSRIDAVRKATRLGLFD